MKILKNLKPAAKLALSTLVKIVKIIERITKILVKKVLRLTRLLSVTIVTTLLIVISITAGRRAHKHFLYDYKGSSVVMLKGEMLGQESGGTGFQVITPNKNTYTMTNYHVCMLGQKNQTLKAELNSGKTQTLKILYYSRLHDLCLLEPVKGLKPLLMAMNIQNHEEVHIVGHPRLELRTIQSGSVVSHKKTQILMIVKKEHACKAGKEHKPNFFFPPPRGFSKQFKYCLENLNSMHTNAISYGGNSGSPVLNDFGNVVGVLFAGIRGIPNSSLVVPLESIKLFLNNK